MSTPKAALLCSREIDSALKVTVPFAKNGDLEPGKRSSIPGRRQHVADVSYLNHSTGS